LQQVYLALREAGAWTKANPEAAARILGPLWGNLDSATVQQANARRSYDVQPVKLDNLTEHQPQALDTLPMREPYRWDDCGWVANRWLELLPLPLPLKQQLLTLDNPMLRLELVADQLERMGVQN
jgi:ABC-type nitrate/sulfonate/bicarbonate transport system substrate-binding protein